MTHEEFREFKEATSSHDSVIKVSKEFYEQLNDYFCNLFDINQCYGKQRKQVYIKGLGYEELDDIYTVIMSEGHDGSDWYVEFTIDDKDNMLSCDYITVNFCKVNIV